MGNLQNSRILRFLIVLTAVILTIFIYASYSNSQNLLPPPMRAMAMMPASESQFQLYNNNNHNILINQTNHNSNSISKEISTTNGAATFVKNMTNNYKPIKRQQQQEQQQLHIHNKYQHHQNYHSHRFLHLNDVSRSDGKKSTHHYHHQHREPTVDENANNNNESILTSIDDLAIDANTNNNSSNNSDLMQEEQYVQTIDSALEHINQTTARESNQIHIFPNIKHKELLDSKKQQQQPQQKQQQVSVLNDNNNGNNNKITESDVLIATLNVQKFIENADKLLKSLTLQQQQQQQQQQEQQEQQQQQVLQQKQQEKYHAAKHNEILNKLLPPPPLPPSNSSNKQTIVKNQLDLHKDTSSNHKLPIKLNLKTEVPKEKKSSVILIPASSKSVTTTLLQINSSNSVKLQQKQQLNEKLNAQMATHKVNASSKNKNLKPNGGPLMIKANSNSTKMANGVNMEVSTLELYESGHRNSEIDVERFCPKKGVNLKLLILITSAQNHADARMAIRQTWGHFGTRRDVSTAFILGRTTNQTLNLAITQENFIFGDLIRGQFIDSYNNLTLKTLSALEWVDQNCPKVKFILKTDDDMFINVPKLLQFLDNHSKDKKTIFGRLAKKWKPIRNKKSKYYVSTGQFGATIFPPFTTGPAYVITNDCIHDLYVKALQQIYLKLEDVFTTGIVAQQLGINRIHVNEFLNRRIVFNPCNIRKAISIHMVKANEQFDLWKKLLDQTTKCK